MRPRELPLLARRRNVLRERGEQLFDPGIAAVQPRSELACQQGNPELGVGAADALDREVPPFGEFANRELDLGEPRREVAVLTAVWFWSLHQRNPVLWDGGDNIIQSARRVALASTALFHLGTAVLMGLVTFAAFMISLELSLVSDRDYRTVASWAGRLGRRRTRE